MKKLLFVAGMFTLGCTATFAQDVKASAPMPASSAKMAVGAPTVSNRTMDPKAIAQMKSARLERDLSLTPEQTAKVKAIFEAQAPDPAKRMTENVETEKKIKAVLTPDQVTKFDAMRAQREEMMKARKDRAMQQQIQAQPAQAQPAK
jgi:Spy/CpxP family protein refolding chaperone